MTSQPEPCGSNCKGSDWVFANSATEDKFACAVCISRYVREHYQEKKALFLPSLDALERALGDFKAGWKETRIAKMERIWKNDALEEQTALETLGRFCEAIDGEPQEEDGEALVTAKRGGARAKNAEPSIPLMVVESKTIRLKDAERKPTMTRKNQLPAPSSRKPVKERTTVENERGRKKASRLPVGPMSWRKQMEVVK